MYSHLHMYSQREDFFLCNRRRKEEENLSLSRKEISSIAANAQSHSHATVITFNIYIRFSPSQIFVLVAKAFMFLLVSLVNQLLLRHVNMTLISHSLCDTYVVLSLILQSRPHFCPFYVFPIPAYALSFDS